MNAKLANPELMVVLFGVNRAHSITYPNLTRQVLEPLERQAVNYAISWAFNEIGALRNPRSGEVGLPTEFDSARALKALQGTLLDQDHVDRIIQPQFEAAAACGDPWDDGFVSLRNHLRYLYVLQVATRQALALAPHCRWFFFVRPDLLFSEPLDLAGLIANHPNPHQEVVISASWHRWWGGTNDRFALVTRGPPKPTDSATDRSTPFCGKGSLPCTPSSFCSGAWISSRRLASCRASASGPIGFVARNRRSCWLRWTSPCRGWLRRSWPYSGQSGHGWDSKPS
jgi:hypothetical protein